MESRRKHTTSIQRARWKQRKNFGTGKRRANRWAPPRQDTTDQTNNLKEGDRVLLLSEKELDDLTGISTLTVEDDGETVPLATL